jgi:predicted secreted hydrolase
MKKLGTLVLLAAVLTACARNTPIDPAVLRPPSPAAGAASQPQPVVFPRDDAPPADLTEWWYYTGHLQAADGNTYGFELVVFQANRRNDPPGYAAHFAITDNARGDFHYAERAENGKQVHAGSGFDLNLSGWAMKGSDGQDHLTADMQDYAIDLALSSSKPPVLHDGKGFISFGPAGDSYYYSRTRLDVLGSMVDHGQTLAVSGVAWMDHQWGDFVSGGGGWDWFSIQLDDRSEVMLFFLRDPRGMQYLRYGTYVAPDGSSTILDPSSFAQEGLGSWESPTTGITYPSGWKVTAGDATLRLEPTVKAQELRTGQTTGVTYWEGDVAITGTKAGKPVSGAGYVELVGYH